MEGSSLVAKRKKPARSSSSSRRPAPPRPWWGEGAAPHVRWPGVTIEIRCKWVAKRARWETTDGLYYFDMEEADRACDFFPTYLRHHKGEFADQPFHLLEYQSKLVIRPLFGWKRVTDGLRRFRKVFVAVPKGNGKSPLGGGLGLYLLLCDREEGAEIYAAAADRDQAGIVFGTAKIMVEQSADVDGDGKPDLLEMCEVYARSIAVPSTNSSFKVLSADVATKHGYNIQGLIFDEFHAQRTRDLYEALYRGMLKRRQPVLFMVTTAGDDDESICYEEWEYARSVISGTIPDDTSLPVIFELAKDDDWTSIDAVARVNPGYGVTIKADGLAAEIQAAMNQPRKRNDYLRYHGNRWTSSAVAWIPIEWWDACPLLAMPLEELRGYPRACGLDMAQKIDLTSFSVCFRLPLLKHEAQPEDLQIVTLDADGNPISMPFTLNFREVVITFFWIPELRAIEREKETGIPFKEWREKGLIRFTEGMTIDYETIYRQITTEIMPAYGLKGAEMGFDPAFATDLAQRLERASLKPIEIRQNYIDLSEPSQVWEALVKSGRVIHDGNRVMRWNMENVAVKTDDAGRIRPTKPGRRSGTHKNIDGVVSSIQATKLLMHANTETDVSVHAIREPLVLSMDDDDRAAPASPEDLVAARERKHEESVERWRKALEGGDE